MGVCFIMPFILCRAVTNSQSRSQMGFSIFGPQLMLKRTTRTLAWRQLKSGGVGGLDSLSGICGYCHGPGS